MFILGLILAILAGISLGLIGSGGSILTVPILVYIVGVDPVLATAYSLFIVGTTALFGGVQNAIQGNVVFKTALIFGVPSILGVYLTRAYLMPVIPKVLFHMGNFQFTKSMGLMILFAVVMILASLSMIFPRKAIEDSLKKQRSVSIYDYSKISLEGLIVGVLAGMVGAGGGFLIIPTLVILAKIPMKKAIGTSLFIIAVQSLLGFTGDLNSSHSINWNLLLLFTLSSITGIFIGIIISKKVSGKNLKVGFGWFVMIIGVFILIKEILL